MTYAFVRVAVPMSFATASCNRVSQKRRAKSTKVRAVLTIPCHPEQCLFFL